MAEVYKCVVASRMVYQDRACDIEGKPATLPPITTIKRHDRDDLAKRYDERLSREKKSRDISDAAFLKDHAAKIEREKAVRKAIIDHQVIRGMTPSEVESAMGPADEKLPEGGWRYRRDGQRTSIAFKDGQVSSVSTTSEKKSK